VFIIINHYKGFFQCKAEHLKHKSASKENGIEYAPLTISDQHHITGQYNCRGSNKYCPKSTGFVSAPVLECIGKGIACRKNYKN